MESLELERDSRRTALARAHFSNDELVEFFSEFDVDEAIRRVKAVLAPGQPLPQEMVTRATLFFLQDAVEKGMEGSVLVRMPRVPLPNGEALQLQVEPDTLFGCLWLQFARAIAGVGNFNACGHCGNEFAVGRRTARPDKQYCSPACRVAAHRDRRKAKRLSQEGQSIQAIAKELGVHVATIRNWLQEKGEKQP
jgi:hypothetical protein